MKNDKKVSVEFTEDMKGFFYPETTEPAEGFSKGEEAGLAIMFHLTIAIPDVEFFLLDPREQGVANGYIDCERLGGKCVVKDAAFRLFVEATGVAAHENVKNMRYQLQFVDGDGRPKTLSGHKIVRDNGVQNMWSDTSTLYFQILDGHVDMDASGTPNAAGILHILPADFAHQMTTFKTTGPNLVARMRGLDQFFKLFAGSLWSVYAPKLHETEKHLWSKRDIPVMSLEGVNNAETSTHYITTDDKLTLSMMRFTRGPCRNVVVLMHGLSTSTDMFVMPEHYNLVNYLLDNGYTDVFSFDWRGSMRHNYDLFPNTHNMDDVALFDHPAAMKKIRELVGDEAKIHVICHCVGSITFCMSLFSGLVEADSVISNSVSLNPTVSRWSQMKLSIAPYLILYILRFPNLNPRWGTLPGPGMPQGKLRAKAVSRFHRECDVSACHMLSFMWGDGHPAVWQHENMHEVTHHRAGDLFGAVSINYYRHLAKCTKAKSVVKFAPEDPLYDSLPDKYTTFADKINTPCLFVSGDQNHVFPGSNQTTVDVLNRLHPDNNFEFKSLPGYGHQDPFMGKDVATDVFPTFLEFLNKHSE